jgi:hypothetical protein
MISELRIASRSRCSDSRSYAIGGKNPQCTTTGSSIMTISQERTQSTLRTCRHTWPSGLSLVLDPGTALIDGFKLKPHDRDA